jgi:hypothetical protein
MIWKKKKLLLKTNNHGVGRITKILVVVGVDLKYVLLLM